MQSAFRLETNEQEGGALSKVKYESRALRVIRRACACVWEIWPCTLVCGPPECWQADERGAIRLSAPPPPLWTLTAGRRHTGISSLTAIITSLYDRLPLSVTVSISLALANFPHLYLSVLCPLLSALFRYHAAPCCSITIICVFLQPAHLSFSPLSRSHLQWGQGRVPSCPLYQGMKMATAQQEAQRFNPGTSTFKRAQCQNHACTANKH